MSRGSNLAEKVNVIEGYYRPIRLTAVRRQDPLEETLAGKTIRRHVYEFGLILGIVLSLIAIYFARTEGIIVAPALLAALGIGLVWLSKNSPLLVRPLWKGWMAVGGALGAIVTTILLSVSWALMFVPLALILRSFGKTTLDMSFRKPVDSYFEDRSAEESDFKLLERQY